MNTDTPETDRELHAVQYGTSRFSFPEHARRMERERDEWKAKYIQQNKDLGCELLDPNGTIWDHAKTLQRERDEARIEMIRWQSIAEGRGRTDDEDTGKAMANLIHQRDALRKQMQNNPWCAACKEKNCCVSGDGTCAMIRKYLSTNQ